MQTSIRSVGTSKGIVYAFGIGVACLIGGVLLTLTFIGAVLGIPLIMAGLAFIFTCPWGGSYISEALCPVCSSTIYIIHPLQKKQVMKCKACKSRLLRGNGCLSKLPI